VPTIDGVGRRQFLVTASTSAVAAAVLGPHVFAAKAAPAPIRRLAVGFASAAGPASLSSASSIPSSDGMFISTGARVTLTGASGASVTPAKRRMVQLLTNFTYLDGAAEKSAPFHSWGASRITGEQGPPTRFTVPVDAPQSISLTVVVESGDSVTDGPQRKTGGSTVVTSLPLLLSVRNAPSALPLVRGFYVIVPLFDAETEPDWTRYQVSMLDGHWAVVDRTNSIAPFEHLVMNVAYDAG
jgi:hypothetical protein